MTKLGTAILLILSATAGAGCDSNPTPHPIHDQPDARGPNIGGGDVVGTELGANPSPGEQDPDNDPDDCPCAGADSGFNGESGSRNDDDNTTDPCDDDNATDPEGTDDGDDTDAESPEPSVPTVRKKR